MLACGREAVPDVGLSGLVCGSAAIVGGDDGCGGEVGVGVILLLPLMLEFAEAGGGV
jgi:hypothetical protein